MRVRKYGVAIFALALLVSTHWFTLNISSSVPLGLYYHVPVEGALRRGDMVLVHAVSFGRSWLASWLPLLSRWRDIRRYGLCEAGRASSCGRIGIMLPL